jgi:hypothetical protein
MMAADCRLRIARALGSRTLDLGFGSCMEKNNRSSSGMRQTQA